MAVVVMAVVVVIPVIIMIVIPVTIIVVAVPIIATMCASDLLQVLLVEINGLGLIFVLIFVLVVGFAEKVFQCFAFLSACVYFYNNFVYRKKRVSFSLDGHSVTEIEAG